MPSKAPAIPQIAHGPLTDIAAGIREQRRSLGISVVVAAYAAGMSRLTWHRIEKAEPSVTMGAYLGALNVIGLDIALQPTCARNGHKLVNAPIKASINAPMPPLSVGAVARAQGGFKAPQAIPIRNYPQLRQIAWHIQDDFELTQAEARNLYERNSRYLDLDQMPAHEAELFTALQLTDPLEIAKA